MNAPPFATAPALASAPGLRHGFFGREGGFGQALYASLNIGAKSGDDPDVVAKNRALVASGLGFAPNALALVRQVHGAHCATLDDAARTSWTPVEADAIATKERGVLIGALSADCAPVLLADMEAGVIGAAHAGWRGALKGIVESAVAAMMALGADRARIAAAIGPCIARDNYEVGPDFVDAFADDDAAAFFEQKPGARPHFDLEAYVAERLRRAGVATVERLRLDTYADETRYFSARRAFHRGEKDFGVQVSVIGLEAT